MSDVNDFSFLEGGSMGSPVEEWIDPDVKELAAALYGDVDLFSQASAADRMHFYGLASLAMSWFVSKYAEQQGQG